jgi:signal transduction histidine kinase
VRTISRQILSTLLLTILIVLGGWSAFEIRNALVMEEMKLDAGARLVTERLAYNLVNPLWNMNLDEVEKTILYEIRADMISAVIVKDEFGNIHSGKVELTDGRIENWNPDNSLHRNMTESGAKKISKNIVHNDKTIGTVVLYTNSQYLDKLLRAEIIRIIIKLVVLVLILFCVMYALLRYVVVKPLTRLKDWATTVTTETRTVAPEMRNSVELVSLATAISSMSCNLTKSYDDIHEQTVQLETEMAERQLANEALQLKTAELEGEVKERRAAQQTLLEQTVLLQEEIAERERLQQEHDRLEEQLRQSQKMEAIGLLAGGVAHDFNNILSVIMGYGDLLARGTPDGKMHDNAIQLLKASERAAELTRGLLAFSRKQTFNLERIDINQLATENCKFLKRIIGEDIELVTEFHPKPLFLSIDKSQIQQVLMNLATNARDAMLLGGKLTIRITSEKLDDSFISGHGFGTPGDYARIQVSDTGAGMDNETVQRIFEPFFTTKENAKGTGLGLSIIHGIITQHNGIVSCRSEQGRGTVFTIYLPLCPESEQSSVILAEIDRNSPFGTETILLADDDEMLMEINSHHLESSGYRVYQAFDGAEAVEIFRNHADEIDLVILDAIMPKMTGKQAWDNICEIRPNIKACFFSGYANEIISGKIAVDYSLPFIAKPVMPGVLLRKVREILDGVNHREEN